MYIPGVLYIFDEARILEKGAVHTNRLCGLTLSMNIALNGYFHKPGNSMGGTSIASQGILVRIWQYIRDGGKRNPLIGLSCVTLGLLNWTQ
jgi:hypothetical protein